MVSKNINTLFISILLAIKLLSSLAYAEEEAKTPRNKAWLLNVDLSKVPNLPVRPVGSGICPDTDCDGPNNDLCFESCGNDPAPDDIYGCPKEHHWALTFDDGPSGFTNELLDILDQANVKATFCVMGSQVSKYPETLKRAYDAGHQIASHTFSHPHLMSLTNEEIVYEVKATEEAIEKVIGVKPRYIRPPFGEADVRVKALLRSMGYKVLLWNVDPTDYDVYKRKDVSSKIQGSFKMAALGKDTGLNAHDDPGFISLQHDLYKESIQQVPDIINYLKSQGYKLTTAAECNNDVKPHTDNSSSAASSNSTTPSEVASIAAVESSSNPVAVPNDSSMAQPLAKSNSADSSDETSQRIRKASKVQKEANSSEKNVMTSGYLITLAMIAAYITLYV